jgi:hypothetical protein
MAGSFSHRLFYPKIFIATILAVVMSSVGAYAQRDSGPIHKRAKITDIVDANGNRAGRRPRATQRTELKRNVRRYSNSGQKRMRLDFPLCTNSGHTRTEIIETEARVEWLPSAG